MTINAIEESDWTACSGATPLLAQSGCQHAEDVAAAMYEDAERIKRGEIEDALGKLDARGDLSDSQREIVERMADAIVGHLLAAPITCIHGAGDRSALDTAVRLFDLEVAANNDEMREDGSHRPEVTSVGN